VAVGSQLFHFLHAGYVTACNKLLLLLLLLMMMMMKLMMMPDGFGVL